VVFILVFLSKSECFYARGQKLFKLKPTPHKQKILGMYPEKASKYAAIWEVD